VQSATDGGFRDQGGSKTLSLETSAGRTSRRFRFRDPAQAIQPAPAGWGQGLPCFYKSDPRSRIPRGISATVAWVCTCRAIGPDKTI